MIPLSTPLHHGEPGNPILLGWIKHRLDELTNLDPAVIAVALGLVIVAVPAAILLFYVVQRRHFHPR